MADTVAPSRNPAPAPDRLSYRPITDRPSFAWPGDKRLAVYFAVCVEWFAYGPGRGLALSPGLSSPDTYNWGWREYGNRVGGFRLIDLFDSHQLPISVLLNTDCYRHCPELVAAHRDRGDEIVAHGRTSAEHQNGLSEAGDLERIRAVLAGAIKSAEKVAEASAVAKTGDDASQSAAVIAPVSSEEADRVINETPSFEIAPSPVPYPQEVYIQFAGSLTRAQITALNAALRGAGWRVQGKSGERTPSALRFNEVRYSGESLPAAEALAAAINSSRIVPTTVQPKRVAAIGANHLEIWISR